MWDARLVATALELSKYCWVLAPGPSDLYSQKRIQLWNDEKAPFTEVINIPFVRIWTWELPGSKSLSNPLICDVLKILVTSTLAKQQLYKHLNKI